MSEHARPSRRQIIGLVGAGVASVATGGLVTWRVSRTGERVAIPAHAMSDPATTTAVEPDREPLGDSTTTSTTSPPAGEPAMYVPVRDEVFVDAKMVGVRAVESLMLYTAGERHLDPVRRTLDVATPGVTESVLVAASAPLFVAGADSIASVVYPQLGGLSTHRDPTSGSVMVVAEQRLRRDGAESVVSRCIDVRVHLVDGDWRVQGIEDASGEPVRPPDELPDEAVRVLEHRGIDIPDSVRWDIYDGIVHRRILEQMAELADDVPIGVTTCMRGHPINVFGTPNRSAHSVGRAVDIWSVDGRPVVQQRDDTSSAAYSVCEQLFRGRRVERLGAPWAFDPPGGWSWTDPVHQDHLHLGVSG